MQKTFAIILFAFLGNLLAYANSQAKPVYINEYKYKNYADNTEIGECESFGEGLISRTPDNSTCEKVTKGGKTCYRNCRCSDGFVPKGSGGACIRYNCDGYDYTRLL